MSMIDHLEELRWHIIRAASAVVMLTVGAFFIAPWVFEHIIFAPSRASFPTFSFLCNLGRAIGSEEAFCIQEIPFNLQNRTMSGQLSMHIMASFVIGFILAFPYVIWELYRFLKPGLYKHERKYSRGAVAAVSTLFICGILFAFFVLCPIMISFFATYRISDAIVNEFDISSYVSTMVGLLLGTGLLFQLPMIILFLTRMGIVTPQTLRKKRKHAVITILVTGAIVTPTADPMSQALIAIPLYILYEASIMISEKAERDRLKEAARVASMDRTIVSFTHTQP